MLARGRGALCPKTHPRTSWGHPKRQGKGARLSSTIGQGERRDKSWLQRVTSWPPALKRSLLSPLAGERPLGSQGLDVLGRRAKGCFHKLRQAVCSRRPAFVILSVFFHLPHPRAQISGAHSCRAVFLLFVLTFTTLLFQCQRTLPVSLPREKRFASSTQAACRKERERNAQGLLRYLPKGPGLI